MELISKERLFRSENIVYDDKKVWTKLSWFSDILEIDRTNGDARVIPLPMEYDNYTWSHRSLNKRGRTIFILPFKARELLLLDLDTEEYEKVPLPEGIFTEEETEGFTQSIVFKDYLIMFGYYPFFLYYHIPSGTFEVVNGIKEKFDEEFKPVAWFSSWAGKDEKIFVHASTSNSVVELDMEKKNVDIHVLNGIDHIDGVAGIDNGEIICPLYKDENFTLIRWSLNGGYDKDTLPFGSNQAVRPFSWITYVDNKVFMLSGSCQNTCVYEISDKRTIKLDDVPFTYFEIMQEKRSEYPLNYFSYVQMGTSNYITSDRIIITIHLWSGKLVFIDLADNVVEVKNINLGRRSIERLNYEEFKKRNVNDSYYCGIDEKDAFGGLEGFITFLVNSNHMKYEDT